MPDKQILPVVVLMSVLTASVSHADEPKDGSSFAIRPDYSHQEIYGVYEQLKKEGQPQFITTDLVLHTGHLLFDYSLRVVEIDRLYSLADQLTKTMTQALREGPPGLSEADQAALLAYFCVPAKILDPGFEIPPNVERMVAEDLQNIEKHDGFRFSAALDNGEDFSQYVPRGHYTRNERFQRYFKAMMWYGRRMFRVQEDRPKCLPGPCNPDRWSDRHLLSETRQMLVITRLLHDLRIDGKPAIETWEALYRPTALFAGRTEDLNALEVRSLMNEAWGGLPKDGDLTDDGKIRQFAALAAKFSKPKVDSTGAGRKGFGFMPQRFTPDAYITQCLVTEADIPFGEGVPPHPLAYSGKRKPPPFTWGTNRAMDPAERRFMPRGLDVMAVFGSKEALAILESEGDTAYKGYDEMLTFLQREVGTMMKERREENLYYAWLYALQPLMQPIQSDHVPACLKSKAWLRKQLAASLGSWTELRHDTILYAKQSYTPTAKSMGGGPKPTTQAGYVEPQPEVFRRMAKMVTKARTDLAALGVLPEGLEGNYDQFASICEELAAIAEKEVAGEPLSGEEGEFIRDVAANLRATTILPAKLRAQVLSETDAQMALIADVHTDTNVQVVLEEAVGTPFLLTVRMPLGGKVIELRGAVFSYYEFKQPMKDRLTDEAWQERLAEASKRPALPAWLHAESTRSSSPVRHPK